MSEENKKINERELEEAIKVRPRSPTLLKLKMFADMFRKTARIKEQVQKGEYKVDSQKIAESIVGSKVVARHE